MPAPNLPGLEPVKHDSILLPDGSLRNIRETAAARAVADYDDDLVLAQHKQDGQWAVFIKTEGEGLRPVLGLGFELPSPEQIRERLYRADTKIHGGRLALDVARRNEQRQAQLTKKADESTAEVVEHFDWALRSQGVHPHPRIFVPSKKED